MLLNYFSLPKVLGMLLVVFVFGKIYQHNLLIKLNYERQRFEKKKMQREKEKNELTIKLLSLLEPERVLAKAKDEWGMRPMTVRQIRALSQESGIDFLKTSSHDSVLQKLGFNDVVMSHTRR